MAPQPPKESSQLGVAMAAAFKKLTQNLREAKKTTGEIKIPKDVINPISESLRAYRNSSTNIKSSLVADIVSELNDEGNSICSRLEVSVYILVLHAILQVTYSRKVERGVYLLAASLYHDNLSSTQKRTIEARKAAIGKGSLQLLLDYFTAINNHAVLRRWVGIMCLQLLQESNENIQRFSLGSEDTRRKLGGMLSKESNEILRILCGQLIKALLNSGMSRENLWPQGTNAKVYEGFPDASQPDQCWNQMFQLYVDRIDESPETPAGQLYFAQNVTTVPAYNFGSIDRVVNIVIDVGSMSILALASATRFDQCLEIPLNSIKRMCIYTKAISQLPTDTVMISFKLENRQSRFCFLDAVGIVLSQIAMVVRLVDIGILKDDVSRLPGVEVVELGDFAQEDDYGEGRAQQSRSIRRSFESDEIVAFDRDEGWVQINSANPQNHELIPETQNGRGSTPEEVRSSHDHACSNELSGGTPDEETIHILAPSGIEQKPISNPTEKRLKGKKMVAKLKAKKPLAPSQVSKIDKRKAASSASQVGNRTKVSTPSQDGLFGQKLQESVTRLQRRFPGDNDATLRGALVASNGNLETAANTLQNRQELRRSPRQPQGTGNFDLESFTSPDTNDRSTPKTKKAVTGVKLTGELGSSSYTPPKRPDGNQMPTKILPIAKQKQIQYSLKAKAPLSTGEIEKPQVPSQKRKRNGREENSDIYEITDDISDGELAAPPKKTKKTGTKANSKVPLAKSQAKGKNPPKITKSNVKNGQSARAALTNVTTASRSKRGAAALATQRVAKIIAIEDDVERAEESVASEKQTQGPQRSRKDTSQGALEPSLVVKPPQDDIAQACTPNSDKNPPDLQAADVAKLGLMYESFGKDTHGWIEDMYDASPKRPAVQPSSQTTARQNERLAGGSKCSSQPEVDFTSKLGDVLAEIGEESAPGNIQASMILSHVQHIPTWRDSELLETPKNHEAEAESHSADTPLSCGDDSHAMSQTDSTKPNKSKRISPNRTGQQASIVVHVDKGEYEFASQIQTNDNANIVNEQSGLEQPVFTDDLTASEKNNKTIDSALNTGEYVVETGNKSMLDMPVTPNERVAISNKVKKQKASDEMSVPSKRRVPEENKNQARREERRRKSPRIEAKTQKAEEKGAIQSRRPMQKSPSSSLRCSPRLEERAKRASEVLNGVLSGKSLVDDHLSRKAPIVAFDSKGAINQGLSSVLTSSTKQDRTAMAIEQLENEPDGQFRGKKRGREDSEVPENHVKRDLRQGKKLKSISLQLNNGFDEMDHPNHQDYSSSFRAPRQLCRRRSSRLSSQPSRVDMNGSPMPLTSASKVDHISRIEKKLMNHDEGNKVHGKGITNQESSIQHQGRKSVEIFGPKVRLASIAKARPSSPEEVATRYVKHRKMQDGLYEGFDTEETVAPEKTLADPFVTIQKRRSSFTERLQGVATKAQKGIFDELEQTLVESQNQLLSLSPASQGSSNDVWNVALRSHYARVSDAIHRIANEVIIRLANEEDVMGLLINQYEENGSKILCSMTEKREVEKARIHGGLERRKRVMMSIYSEGRDFVLNSEKQTKSLSPTQFEKEWRREQIEIQKRIDEGRRV